MSRGPRFWLLISFFALVLTGSLANAQAGKPALPEATPHAGPASPPTQVPANVPNPAAGEKPVAGAVPTKGASDQPPKGEGTPPPTPGGESGAGAAAGGDSPLSVELESFLEPYIYDPKGRRDPFKPYVEVKPEDESDVAGPLLPLQQYDVDQLRLVGVIWNVNDPKAMFVDPKGQVHVVRRDERIGRKNGYVAVIREGEVVVVEAVNVNGDLMYSTRVLKIQQKQERSTR